MEKNKLKIGEFSRLGRVTVRALRHYEEIDLLTPEIVDRDTGYRYYSVGQLQKLFSITKLKSMGYSLEEIRDLWDDDQHFPTVESLEEKIRKCEDELAVLKERKRMLKVVVASQKKLHKMENVYFESLPAITVASHRTVIPSFEDLGRLCYEVIGPEMARLGCECPEPGYCYTIEHGGYKPKDIDIEYCEKVTAKGKDSAIIKFKDVPEVPTAVCMKVYGPYDRLYQNYIDLLPGWRKKAGKWPMPLGPSTWMASGIRKTPRSGSPSSRCRRRRDKFWGWPIFGAKRPRGFGGLGPQSIEDIRHKKRQRQSCLFSCLGRDH